MTIQVIKIEGEPGKMEGKDSQYKMGFSMFLDENLFNFRYHLFFI